MFPENSCSQSEEVAAFLAGELPPAQQASFGVHVQTCPACQAERESLSRVRALLGGASAAPISADFTARVMERVQKETTPSRWRPARVPRVPLAWAAALALLCGLTGGWLATRGARSPVEPLAIAPETAGGSPVGARLAEISSVREAQAWLLAAQEPDGSWDAKRWGGDRRFQPALTALPLLALLESSSRLPEDGADALIRACESLQRTQDEHGNFGPTFQGGPYNQGIATLALLHAYQLEPKPELKQSLQAALSLILERQTPAGGWGYLYTPLPNLSVSLWHIECLRLAAELGWEEAREPLRRSLAWRAQHGNRPSAGETEASEPSNSPSRDGAMTTLADHSATADFDYCRAYFRAATLRQGKDGKSRRQLAELRRALRGAQVHEGELSGSWGLDDRWSKVGGRLYTTSLASLALR